MTSNHLLHTHVVVPTCKSLRLDEDEIASLLSFTLNTPSIHLTSFFSAKPSPTANSILTNSRQSVVATNSPPLYLLSGSVEVIPLVSVPLGHLEGIYTGHLNTSSKSYCRMGCHHPTTSSEKVLREEYWSRFISTSMDASPSPPHHQSLSSTTQDTVTYLPSHLSLSSPYFLQKGFSSTITFAVKQLEKTIEYLNRYPVILEALLDSSSSSANLDSSLTHVSNYFIGKELSSTIDNQNQHKELLLGSIGCCISTGNVISSSSSSSSRQKLKQHSIGKMTPAASVFDVLGFNLPGSVHIGVSYHGTSVLFPFLLYLICSVARRFRGKGDVELFARLFISLRPSPSTTALYSSAVSGDLNISTSSIASVGSSSSISRVQLLAVEEIPLYTGSYQQWKESSRYDPSRSLF